MRRPLRRVGTAVAVLIVLLLGNLTYLQVVDASALRNDPHNSRTDIAEQNRQRGQITAVGGVVLAQSVSSPASDPVRYQRVYPLKAEYQPITGYFSSLYGETQIEKSQNSFLSGDDDALIGDQFIDLITGRDPRGGTVQLSVIPAVQDAAYNGLQSKGYAGAVVAIRPATGEILAMASTPNYDPNPLASHNTATQKRQSDIINNSTPSLKLNRATQQVYPPGSTFKLVDLAAALQTKFYTPDTMVPGVPTLKLPSGSTISNFELENCGDGGGDPVTLTEALAHSCNTAFADVALKIGSQPIRDAAAALGVDGNAFDIDVPVVGSRLGTIADQDALAQSSIGQRDVVFTPVQDAMVVATIANKGVRMQPHIVSRLTGPDLTVLKENKPVVANQNAIPAAVADQITKMMITSEQDTAGYTAPGAGDPVIASKTGTAEHGTDPKNTPPHCWYVAFAPATNPQIAVAVLVENGGDGSLNATGGSVAAPIGRAVIKAALQAG